MALWILVHRDPHLARFTRHIERNLGCHLAQNRNRLEFDLASSEARSAALSSEAHYSRLLDLHLTPIRREEDPGGGRFWRIAFLSSSHIGHQKKGEGE